VYKNKLPTLEELKQKLRHAIKNYTKKSSPYCQMRTRANACIIKGGGHFQNILQ